MKWGYKKVPPWYASWRGVAESVDAKVQNIYENKRAEASQVLAMPPLEMVLNGQGQLAHKNLVAVGADFYDI